MRLALAGVAALAVLVCPAPAAAHPHVFVDNAVAFVFGQEGLEGVRVDWLFDDMFGTMILEQFDTDGDGEFSQKEVEGLKTGAFDNLKNFDWFTFLTVDGQPCRPSRVEGFRAGMRGGHLFYTFFVPCPVPAAGGERTVVLSVHDPEYYADVYTPEQVVPVVEHAEAFDARVKLHLDSEKTYSLFQVWTTDIILTFSPK